MIKENQPLEVVDRAALPARAAELMRAGHRLVAITCTVLADAFELTYSFDRDYGFTGLRVMVPRNDATVPSITESYFCAFAYENEIQDLFGLKVPGLKLDYKGNFYRKAAPAPFLQGAPGGEAK